MIIHLFPRGEKFDNFRVSVFISPLPADKSIFLITKQLCKLQAVNFNEVGECLINVMLSWMDNIGQLLLFRKHAPAVLTKSVNFCRRVLRSRCIFQKKLPVLLNGGWRCAYSRNFLAFSVPAGDVLPS